MVKENNRDDGDVKLFPKIIGIASLLKNEPSTSHCSENLPSLRSSLLHIPRSLIFWKLFKNIWLQRKRKKDMEEKKKMEKKEHLEKKNIFFCRGIEKQRRKIFRPQRRRRTETEKEENLLEKENVTMCDRHTDIVKKELELWTQILQKIAPFVFSMVQYFLISWL